MAQVKEVLTKKIDPNFNITNLGFCKLKNLIESLSGKLVIDTVGDNITKVIK